MKRALLTLLALSGTAHAYVRSRSTHGVPTHWAASCAIVQPDSGGTPDLDDATTYATEQTSMQAWKSAVQGCSYMTLSYETPAPLEATYDGKNTIKFRTDKWCHPNDSQSNNVCYSAAAAGITSVFYNDTAGDSHEGELLDTDVELNDINFTFVIIDPSAPSSPMPRAGTQIADLENTLVHELGHVQGLDHTCKDSATPANEVDDSGNPPPSCATLSTLPQAEQDKIENATMFNSATPGETKKRSPEADDIDGICAAYPLASDPKVCKPATASHGCDAVPGHRSSMPIALFVAPLALWLARKRRLA